MGHVCCNGNRISTLFESERERKEKSCHRVELYTGAESGWTRSSGIVFTDASRYECRYSDSRGLNPGARKTHLPHSHTHTALKQSPPNVGLFSVGDFFFPSLLSSFPYFSSFNLTNTHAYTHF